MEGGDHHGPFLSAFKEILQFFGIQIISSLARLTALFRFDRAYRRNE
jgi:hypothetical protein